MNTAHVSAGIMLAAAILLATLSAVFLLSPDALSWLNQDGLSYTRNYWLLSEIVGCFTSVVAFVLFRITAPR